MTRNSEDKRPTGNPWVVEALSGLFGSEEGADCDVQFCLEGAEETGNAELTPLGPLLPGHSLVLRHASERFRAQLDRWLQKPPVPEGAESLPAGREPDMRRPVTQSASAARPRLPVPLGSEAELPAALLAVRYAFTGQVHASSVREALEVLRAGDYLAIEGCAAACSQWLADRLAATGAAEAAGSSAAPAEPAVLQLFACDELWPCDDPSFAPVLSAAKVQLVQHFGSTLATLNSHSLRPQLQALPAAALGALLESDDFGTDGEDSAALLLACWLCFNWDQTDAATRQRLCGLVRLTHLNPQVQSLLPSIEIIKMEHRTLFLGILKIAWLIPRGRRSAEPGGSLPEPRCHSTSPRKQCVPEEGLSFPWSISKDALKGKLAGLRPGQQVDIKVDFGRGCPLVIASGLAWVVTIADVAGINLTPELLPTPGFSSTFPADFHAELMVHKWEGTRRHEACILEYSQADLITVGEPWVCPEALPLARPPTVLAAADPLAAWAPYLGPDGGITGTFTLLRPSP